MMATGKRYYWIKLKDSFMSSDAIDYLMSQPDGVNYVCLLYTSEDGKENGGFLPVAGATYEIHTDIPNTVQTLSLIHI